MIIDLRLVVESAGCGSEPLVVDPPLRLLLAAAAMVPTSSEVAS